MNWAEDEVVNGIPVILAGRPARNRPRQISDHARQVVYLQDSNRLLDPAAIGAGLQRSRSASGHGRHSPTQIFINNSQRDDRSPVRNPRRRSQHAHYYYEDDSWDEDTRDHRRDRRHHGRSRSRRRESPTPSPVREHEIEKQVELEQRLKKLDILEQKERDEENRRKYKQEQILKAAREAEERQKEEEMKKRAVEEYNRKFREEQIMKAERAAAEKKKEEELKAKAIQEYNEKQATKTAKEKQDKEAADKAFRDRMRSTFAAAGYSEESIERMLEQEGKGKKEEPKKIMDLSRPTYIKVHRKHLSPDTLDAYSLPWEWDDRDTNYIIIKQWIPETQQDVLFEHTRRMREGRLLTSATVELKKERDKLLIVRKKSPSRRRSRSYLFT